MPFVGRLRPGRSSRSVRVCPSRVFATQKPSVPSRESWPGPRLAQHLAAATSTALRPFPPRKRRAEVVTRGDGFSALNRRTFYTHHMGTGQSDAVPQEVELGNPCPGWSMTGRAADLLPTSVSPCRFRVPGSAWKSRVSVDLLQQQLMFHRPREYCPPATPP